MYSSYEIYDFVLNGEIDSLLAALDGFNGEWYRTPTSGFTALHIAG